MLSQLWTESAKTLELDTTWYEKCRNSREAFGFIRGQLETCGVIVMMNGVGGQRIHIGH